MTKRIYYEGYDEDTSTACEVGDDLIPGFVGECDEDAGYRIEDPAGGPSWLVCTTHKDELKTLGIAE